MIVFGKETIGFTGVASEDQATEIVCIYEISKGNVCGQKEVLALPSGCVKSYVCETRAV